MTDYTEIDGVRTPRPKEQDVRPRTFNGKPWPFAMLVNSEATDRFVLWYIANYKYAFNGFFTQDFYKWMPNTTDVKQHPLYKYQLALRTLFDRHLINYGDKKRLTLKITLKGQVYRIYYNIYFRFIGASAAIIIGLLSVFPNIFNGGVGQGQIGSDSTLQTEKRTPPLSPSDSSQIQRRLNLDSSLTQIDTTKTKDTTTKHK